MKLNQDCIRSVLIYLESVPYIKVNDDGGAVFSDVSVRKMYDRLPDYTKEDVCYSVFNLAQAGYINASDHARDNAMHSTVNYITYTGHEFLESIRDDSRWKNIKKCLGAVRSYSLSAMSAVAEGITGAAISKLFPSDS